MHQALRALNQLVSDQVMSTYAIGGATGAWFYIEALKTEDLDVFVLVTPASSGLVTLSPIYQALIAQGGVVEKGHVRFGSWPVQILTDANDLIAEAIREAAAKDFAGIPTRVFTAEHLCAVALQTGRPKDYQRVRMFIEEGKVDRERLRQLAERHGLAEPFKLIEASVGPASPSNAPRRGR